MNLETAITRAREIVNHNITKPAKGFEPTFRDALTLEIAEEFVSMRAKTVAEVVAALRRKDAPFNLVARWLESGEWEQ